MSVMLFKCVCKLLCLQTPVGCGVLLTLVNYAVNQYLKVTFSQSTRLGFGQNVIKTLINTSRSYDYCWMCQFEFDSKCCLLW